MTITFYPSTEWEMIETPCDWCEGAKCKPGAPDPEYADPWCKGSQHNPNVPTVNFANANAMVIMSLLGIEQDYAGEVPADQLPEIQRKVIAARNSRKRRVPYDADPYDVGGPGTGQCRTIYCGNTDEQTLRRLDQFQELLDFCKEKSCGFYWG